MNTDEIRLLKLGDYIKRCVAGQSDEYYMITSLGLEYKLRKVGSREMIKTDNLDEFETINTSRKK